MAQIGALAGRYPDPRSAILPALWVLHHRQGLLTAEGMAEVARALNLPPGPVEAVASFYSMFFFKPHGRYVVEVCTNVACLVTGAKQVLARFEEQLGVEAGTTTDDGLVTLLEVECIGACGGAPACQVNHAFVEDLTAAKVDVLLDAIRAGKFEPHAFASGDAAARSGTLVDLRHPGANRATLPPGGSAGEVLDLVEGEGRLTGAPP